MSRNIHSVILQVTVVVDDIPEEPVGIALKYLPSEDVQIMSASTPNEYSAQDVAMTLMTGIEDVISSLQK